MSAVLLHIGTGKTGSTSIQSAMSWLAKQGGLADVHYARITHKKHHNELSLLFKPHATIWRDSRSRFPQDDERYRKHVAQVESRFRNELAEHERVVLSAESLSNFKPDEVAALADALRELGANKVKVLMYLREPASLYLSQVQQRLKASAHFPDPAQYRFEYFDRVSRWRACFSDVEIRQFSRETLAGGNVFEDFICVLNGFFGTTIAVSEQAPRPSNESFSATGMALMQRFRELLYSGEDNRFDDATIRLIHRLSRYERQVGKASRPALRPELAQNIRYRHGDDIQQLRKLLGWTIFPEVDFLTPGECAAVNGDVRNLFDWSAKDEQALERLCYEMLHTLLCIDVRNNPHWPRPRPKPAGLLQRLWRRVRQSG